MNGDGDASLVGCLIERLATKLPHRSGIELEELARSDVVNITRSTLIRISAGPVASLVIEGLLSLLANLAKPYARTPSKSHPVHVLLSELCIFELVANCCQSHARVLGDRDPGADVLLRDELVIQLFNAIQLMFEPLPENQVIHPGVVITRVPSSDVAIPTALGGRRKYPTMSRPTSTSRALDSILGSDHELPPFTPYMDQSRRASQAHMLPVEAQVRIIVDYMSLANWSATFGHIRNTIFKARDTAPAPATGLARTAQSVAKDTLAAADEERADLITLRLLAYLHINTQRAGLVIQECGSIFLHLKKRFQFTVATSISFMTAKWFQTRPDEFTTLHSPQQHQARGPGGLTSRQLRRDVGHGPDMLFDAIMQVQANEASSAATGTYNAHSNTAAKASSSTTIAAAASNSSSSNNNSSNNNNNSSNNKNKSSSNSNSNNNSRRRPIFVLSTVQACLLLFLPDVFEVAGGLRENVSRSSSVAKKVSWLEQLRKAIRNSINNNTSGGGLEPISEGGLAVFCMCGILNAARVIDVEDNTGILNFCLDAQEDIRDAVFSWRRAQPAPSAPDLGDKVNSFYAAYHGTAEQYEVELATTAFVCLAELSGNTGCDELARIFLGPTAPSHFKLAIIQACSYLAHHKQSRRYASLFTAISVFVRAQLRTTVSLVTDAYIHNQAKARKPLESPSAVNMTCNILSFLLASPETLFEGAPSDPIERNRFLSENMEAWLLCCFCPDETIRRLAINVGRKIMADQEIMAELKTEGDMESKMAKSMAASTWKLILYTSAVVTDKESLPPTVSELKSLNAFISTVRLILTHIPALSNVGDLAPEIVAQMRNISTLILVSACSADLDVCRTTVEVAATMLETDYAARDDALRSASLPESPNTSLLQDLCSPDYYIIGVVAFQKRYWGLIRQLQVPTTDIINAWHVCFGKFLVLSKDISMMPAESLPEKSVLEWRNYAGFLAAAGGICTSQHATAVAIDDQPALRAAWIDLLGPPDNHDHEEPPLTIFLDLAVRLLACPNGRIRETMREILSNETSPYLFAPLFKTVEFELDALFSHTLDPTARNGTSPEHAIIFAEQTVSLLKNMVERLETSSDLAAASSVHLAAVALNFASFLDGMAPPDSDSPHTLRVKVRVCQLCEAVAKRKEHLNLRDDVRIRNRLLEHIVGWISRPRSPGGAGGVIMEPSVFSGASGPRHDEVARIRKDLDCACMRALAELTFRLPLQPSDGLNDAGTSDIKSQMFHQYFNRFLSLLNVEQQHQAQHSDTRGFGAAHLRLTRDTPHRHAHNHQHQPQHHHNQSQYHYPTSAGAGSSSSSTHQTIHREGQALAASRTTSELAISILSNLLSANIDVGLKHSLNIGYHENLEIRNAFVQVLYNILIQGTEFNHLSDAAVHEKYEELLQLHTSDMTLAMAMSAACPSHEVDELTVSLLAIYEPRGLSITLIEALVTQEVEETETEPELFRGTSVATKMLSVYARWKGADYLRGTLQKVIERLLLTSNEVGLELDPYRENSPEERQRNALQLQVVAKVFVDEICASVANIPDSFRKICSVICNAVTPRFPDSKYIAVGGFIILRFFGPAIVSPESEGLIATAPPKEMRRGLLLIAKIIQNLANNVLFGVKEPYMLPLNDFMAHNIGKVLGFLREISIEPPTMQIANSKESFDFGACVALHRFLYDHWDDVRQRIVSQERRDMARSPAEAARGRSPMLEPMRNLISKLGPPPLSMTWNRPNISVNSPVLYSRFQNFMVAKAFRGPDALLYSRIVYYGGESDDGLPIMCLILRNIDDMVESEALMYAYFSTASRLWHRPFGIFVDCTCYSTQKEVPDHIYDQFDKLRPAEFSQQLARIYIYNMNSTARKHFRRLYRQVLKSDDSPYSPRTVEYHPLGSLQDLQEHFHLSQLHLPKETISIINDTRYVVQPVTRLSKTKGKIDVTIKVGSQWLQVTGNKKQEFLPGDRLSATTNDIFPIGDVEEASTSIQTEDDSAFGLRAENGKVVMYFTSPRKADVLQHIRTAKAKYAKDTRALKSLERYIRPQDVPGTLLNLALTNLACPDPVLRLSSYNLLAALCRAFKFTTASTLLSSRDVSVPLDPSQFIIKISKKLAQAEPQLTLDFLNEFFVGWDSFSDDQKPLSLAYMAPWIPGLRSLLVASETEGDKGRDKVATVFRKLIDVTLADPPLNFMMEQSVWPVVSQDEILLDILFEEIMKAALASGFMDEQTATLTAVATAIGTVTLRGKFMSRLRKTLNRSSLRPTRLLPENSVWPELCVLLQFCLALSFDSGVQSQLYLPEVFHVVTMLANTGGPEVRGIVQRLLINTIHAACTSFNIDEARQIKLRTTIDVLSDLRGELFVNPSAMSSSRDGTVSIGSGQDNHSSSTGGGGATLPAPVSLAITERLAALLFDTCAVAAPSVDLANAWRSRWMSLVASTAFQNNPAIQPRAFTVMGCLAREEVDDDLLYQVLVALRNSIGKASSAAAAAAAPMGGANAEDNGSTHDSSSSSASSYQSEMIFAIVTSLSKMLAKLPSASRYGLQLFWLSATLLRLLPHNMFNCAAQLMESVLTNLGTVGDMRSGGERMVAYLLQGKLLLDHEPMRRLDEIGGLHFTPDNFHFCMCAILVRGLGDASTQQTALRLLATLLGLIANVSSAITTTGGSTGSLPNGGGGGGTIGDKATNAAAAANMDSISNSSLAKASLSESPMPASAGERPNDKSVYELVLSPYMMLMIARTTSLEELRTSLWAVGINSTGVGDVLKLRSAALVPSSSSSSSSSPSPPHSERESGVVTIKDKDLLLSVAIELSDFHVLDHAMQTRSLEWFNEVAAARPGVMIHLCRPVLRILEDVILHSQAAATLQAAQMLLQTLTSSSKLAPSLNQSSGGARGMLNDILEDAGLDGLWRSGPFTPGGGPPSTQQEQLDRECLCLTEKLIELIIM